MNYLLFKKQIFFFALFFSIISFAQSQTVKGKVFEKNSGEPMVGATVKLKELGIFTQVKLDGSFSFQKVNPGTYTVLISYTGYQLTQGQSTEIKVGSTGTTSSTFTMEAIGVEMETISIVSGMNGTDKSVRRLERVSDPLLNILSAKTLQLLPDITVANAIQRVSGVTIEKSNSGEGRYPIIRGMEKRYINTLINGIKIPSPDNKNRFIPLDLFPSELLERLEVSKSLTPSMEGDAIGGTINLQMKDAPSSKTLYLNVAAGYNSILSEQSYMQFNKSSMSLQSPAEKNGTSFIATPSNFPKDHLNYSEKNTPLNTTLGLTYGDRFGKDKKLGLIVSGSYQNIFRGTKSNFFLPNSQPGLDNIPLFSDLQYRIYSSQSQRKGLNSKLDYQFNKNNRISLSNTFIRLDDYQTRIIYDTVALNSLVNNSQRSTWQFQSIYNSTLQGNHNLSNGFKADWSLVYSQANNHIPDQSQFTHQYALVATTLTADKLQSMSRIWSRNSDKDLALYFNLSKKMKLIGKEIEWKLGGVARNKDRDNFYNSYSLDPVLGALYTNINNAAFIFNPTSSGVPSVSGNNYTFNEKITAGYVQGKWQLSKTLEVLGGVRIENTNQHYQTQLTKDVDAQSGDIKYTDYLPSLQLKYSIGDFQNLRLAYYKALARPGFSELIPDGPDGEFFREKGDPANLKHTYADNIDVRYEIYSQSADQLLLGAFYKKIEDPIEITAVKPLNINSLYLQPVNIGTATNYGFEAVLTKYFGYFGVVANYTYTQSSITNDSMITSTRNTSGLVVSKRVSETRPLQGQSNHVGNLSFIYKNPKSGLDIQTALVYTGERISFISPYLGLHYWQAPTTQLDFSFEKRLKNRLTIYGKINNITDAPLELSLHQSYNNYLKSSGSRALALQSDPENKIIIQKDYYRTSYLLGLRYKF